MGIMIKMTSLVFQGFLVSLISNFKESIESHPSDPSVFNTDWRECSCLDRFCHLNFQVNDFKCFSSRCLVCLVDGVRFRDCYYRWNNLWPLILTITMTMNYKTNNTDRDWKIAEYSIMFRFLLNNNINNDN